tara:strand:- start:497 stop:1081 length:585 start_codon:yes stop_codon:yes gene_type:complete
MNKKIFIQVFLVVLILISVSIVYFKFFNQKKNLSKESRIIDQSIDKNEINLIKGLNYLAKVGNDTYNISAKSGKPDEKNKNIMNLFDVSAEIVLENKKKVNIFSKNAEYNSLTYNTKFYQDVKLDSEEHNILCDILKLEFTKKYAILKDNIIYKNANTKILADQVEIDLIKRTTKTSMLNEKDKIKIFINNGIN